MCQGYCGYVFLKVCILEIYNQGCLAGPISGACESWSPGCEFESHIGCRDDLKKILKKILKYFLVPQNVAASNNTYYLTIFIDQESGDGLAKPQSTAQGKDGAGTHQDLPVVGGEGD